MTPAEATLERLAGWHPAGPGPHVTRFEVADGALTLTADRADELSCRLTDLAFATPGPRECTAAELTDLAVRIAEKTAGLGEALRVYEVDSGRAVAVLRSATPTERAGHLFYFEATLAGRQSVSVKRYRAGKTGGGREPVAFALTHESVAKVAGELADATVAPPLA